MKLLLNKLKNIIKNYYLYILIGLIFCWVFFLSFSPKKNKVKKIIDEAKQKTNDCIKEVHHNNMSLTKSEIEHEIKNTKAEKLSIKIKQEMEDILGNVELSDYEKNKELNKLHDSIKVFK